MAPRKKPSTPPTEETATPARGLAAIAANGLLAIGDPHITGRRPGRRTDEDFLATTTGKLEEAISIANEQRLVPLITGDLLDIGDEKDIRLFIKLQRALRSSWTPCWYDQGNHTLTIGRHILHPEPTEQHLLTALIEADLIRPFTGDGSPDLLVLTPTTPVMIGGVSYGREIPTQAGPEWSNGPEHALRILITHHDLEFPGNKIPNAAPVRHIKDIDLTINGHVHDCRQPIKTRGRDKSTACWHFNPGNITRCSIDLEGHVPSVFSLIPERDEEIDPILGVCLPFGMRRHILNYAPEIFDHTGRRIVSETPEAGSLLKDSDFVDLLRDEVQAPETQDASILSDELKVIFERLDTKAPLRELLLLLADPTEADPNSIKIANIS